MSRGTNVAGAERPLFNLALRLSRRLDRGHDPDAIEWLRVLPFIGMHLGCLGVIWVGWSPTALWTAAGLYVLRMFAITGFYHRYFSHRSFRASRGVQFAFALLGATAVQRGPLWWAAHHRHHHAHSDRDGDVHSPSRHGFLHSHVGWFLTRRHYEADLGRVRDLLRFPELRWLDRYDAVAPATLATALFGIGEGLARTAPSMNTDGLQLLVWGFCISTVALYHATYSINSLAHRFGSRRFETGDDSRNSLPLALITLGEGWHNNHHYHPASARQGFAWWEIDVTYYLLRLLEAAGVIHDLKPVPQRVLARARRRRGDAT